MCRLDIAQMLHDDQNRRKDKQQGNRLVVDDTVAFDILHDHLTGATEQIDACAQETVVEIVDIWQ